MNDDIRIQRCKVLDPQFAVFHVGYDPDGSFLPNERPPDWDSSECNYFVEDCEGVAITEPLPYIDCHWIARHLNAAADRENKII